MLNDRLYAMLLRRFGQVLVSNAGQRRIEHKVPDPIRPGKYKFVAVNPGEQYRVNCPKCGEKRKRLYICYLWNTKDAAGQVQGRSLLHCFNESCDMSDFGLIMTPYIRYMPTLTRKASDPVEFDSRPLKDVELPGKCVSLGELPQTHPAVRYVVGTRGFDLKELVETWRLQFCYEHKHPFVHNRIIIPIYWDNRLVGWQARAMGDHRVKYFTMPGLSKSSLLFNGDQARKNPFGVVVEGVFDAMRVGKHGVALLGKTVSYQQQLFMQAWWGRGGVCMMLDPDAVEDMDRLLCMMGKQSYRLGAFKVELPMGRDPEEFTREELWKLITARARAENINLVSLPS